MLKRPFIYQYFHKVKALKGLRTVKRHDMIEKWLKCLKGVYFVMFT